MKFIELEETTNLIKNNDNLIISGFGNYCYPKSLLQELRKQHDKKNSPNNLTVITGISSGNLTYEDEGLNIIATHNLIKKIITSHMGMSKKMAEMLSEIESYTIPLGIYLEMLDSISRNKKFVISKIGINSYCDPRLNGCKSSDTTTEEIVDLIKINDEEYLKYNCFSINVAFIKLDKCDSKGNLYFKKNSIITDAIEIAIATKAQKGIVIAEVEEIDNNLNYDEISVPKYLVDYIVIGEKENHTIQKVETEINKSRLTCATKAFKEIKDNDIINLGVGMPDALSKLIVEKNKKINLTIESGYGGGTPNTKELFGTTSNPEYKLSLFNMIKLYQAKILDICFLGAAEIDKNGNVNVSKFGKRIIGPGGFIDIVSNSKKIVFMTSLLTKNNEPKFKNKIDQITFASINAINNNVEVLYITDVATFKLTTKGLKIIETKDNINIEKEILDKMEFKPELK